MLANKSGKPMKGLHVNVHFQKAMQIALAQPVFYNEPTDLAADGDASSVVIYTWQPFVELAELALLPEISLADFYDVALEIEWADGREIVYLNEACACVPEAYARAVGELDAFDRAELDAMLALAAE